MDSFPYYNMTSVECELQDNKMPILLQTQLLWIHCKTWDTLYICSSGENQIAILRLGCCFRMFFSCWQFESITNSISAGYSWAHNNVPYFSNYHQVADFHFYYAQVLMGCIMPIMPIMPNYQRRLSAGQRDRLLVDCLHNRRRQCWGCWWRFSRLLIIMIW